MERQRLFETFGETRRGRLDQSRLALLTLSIVHHGRADVVLCRRQCVLGAAYRQADPERFVRGRPSVPQLPGSVWINAPREEGQITQTLQ